MLLESASTPWRTGSFRGRAPELLFGAMYEDAATELEAFAPFSRVFCIAAAGCTARALQAAGHLVTAVDINPCQIRYAEARAAGAPFHEGAAERLLARGRSLLPLLGWTKNKLREFLSLREPSEQLRYWRRTLDSQRWRLAVNTLLSRSLLRLAYAGPFVASLPRGFGAHVRARLERAWSNHRNYSNPYAWRLLLGETQFVTEPPVTGIRFVCADAAAYLEACPPASFDAFSLSNISDGAPPSYVRRLWSAVQHAAAPGAVVVARSFREPAAVTPNNWAARDRSLLWGMVNVTGVEELCSTF
jgi:S-adenosylmethionine:diacylglycerol 3-amino-3-carboxypropyl transferase